MQSNWEITALHSYIVLQNQYPAGTGWTKKSVTAEVEVILFGSTVLLEAHILTMRYRWKKKSTLFTNSSFTSYSYFRNKHNGPTQEISSARNETEVNHFKVNEFLETKRTGQESDSFLYSDIYGSVEYVQHVESGVARSTDALCTCWSLGRICLFPQANARTYVLLNWIMITSFCRLLALSFTIVHPLGKLSLNYN